MLAYRHGFHAGNHGDVLKHVVLVHLLNWLGQKPTTLRYIDTHAGAGIYLLADRFAQTTAEYRHGIGALWSLAKSPLVEGAAPEPGAVPEPAHGAERKTPRGGAGEVPRPVADYLALIRRFNPDGNLQQYPGSPAIAQALLREQDEMRLFERHPSDHKLLLRHFGSAAGTRVMLTDGFEALKAEVPPVSRRALVLMDPSYELPTDYGKVVSSLRDAMERFAQGVYMVWYPIVRRAESSHLPERLMRLARNAPKGWLHASLRLAETDTAGFGMSGSGVFVINPPHTLLLAMRLALPWLREELSQSQRSRWLLQTDADAQAGEPAAGFRPGAGARSGRGGRPDGSGPSGGGPRFGPRPTKAVPSSATPPARTLSEARLTADPRFNSPPTKVRS